MHENLHFAKALFNFLSKYSKSNCTSKIIKKRNLKVDEILLNSINFYILSLHYVFSTLISKWWLHHKMWRVLSIFHSSINALTFLYVSFCSVDMCRQTTATVKGSPSLANLVKFFSPRRAIRRCINHYLTFLFYFQPKKTLFFFHGGGQTHNIDIIKMTIFIIVSNKSKLPSISFLSPFPA